MKSVEAKLRSEHEKSRGTVRVGTFVHTLSDGTGRGFVGKNNRLVFNGIEIWTLY